MTDVVHRTVDADDEGIRLDRWFKRHYPDLPHGRLEKLLRTGQIRVDGKRSKSNLRLAPGQAIRVPPMDDKAREKFKENKGKALSAEDRDELRSWVLHQDDDVIVLNKPPGLPVQGGTKAVRHLDGLLDGLRFKSPHRPRLVHRLDKDTSGVLVLARSPAVAASLTAAFRGRAVHKIYWALVAGLARPRQGRIDRPLAKVGGRGVEKMAVSESGDRAVTYYTTLDTAPPRASWLALMPVTGRTHQLRAHCADVGVPIVGDGKYGGAEAFLEGAVSRKLHLHAREIHLPHPNGTTLRVRAPLPAHMLATWTLFDFDAERDDDPFEELDL